jgi:transcriptional regulator with XRE-family HTH domain
MSKTWFESLTYDERASHAMRIKSLRQARGLTQDDLGNEAGVSRATINNWENGTTVPQADKLEVVFRALGVQLDDSEFEPATQEWLAVMGVLVEKIPAADRQPVMNSAITLVARGAQSAPVAPIRPVNVAPTHEDDFEVSEFPGEELPYAALRGTRKADEPHAE